MSFNYPSLPILGWFGHQLRRGAIDMSENGGVSSPFKLGCLTVFDANPIPSLGLTMLEEVSQISD